MIEIVASAALIASASSVSTAYALSRSKYKETLRSRVDEQISILFPCSTKSMPTFNRVVQARAKAKIRPMSRKEAALMSQHGKIVKTLAKARLGAVNERKVRAAGNVCWKILKTSRNTYWYHEMGTARSAYDSLTALEKGRMSDEYIDQMCFFIDNTFDVHANRFMDRNYKQKLNIEGFKQIFTELVEKETTVVVEKR